LKQVVVVAVDQDNLHRRTTQRARDAQPAKSCAYDDDYFVSLRHNAARGS
jgi:hypothetical protein